MLIIMKSGSGPEDVDRVREVIQGLGFESRALELDRRPAVRASGYGEAPHPDLFETLPGVELVLPVRHTMRHVGRQARSGRSDV